jgi:hypothetical protein
MVSNHNLSQTIINHNLPQTIINQIIIEQWTSKPAGSIPLFIQETEKENKSNSKEMLTTDGHPVIRLRLEELAIEYRIRKLTHQECPSLPDKDQETLNKLFRSSVCCQLTPLKILKTRVSALLKQLTLQKLNNYSTYIYFGPTKQKLNPKSHCCLLDNLFVETFSRLENYQRFGKPEDFNQAHKELKKFIDFVQASEDSFPENSDKTDLFIKNIFTEILKYTDLLDHCFENSETFFPYLLMVQSELVESSTISYLEKKEIFWEWLKDVSNSYLLHIDHFTESDAISNKDNLNLKKFSSFIQFKKYLDNHLNQFNLAFSEFKRQASIEIIHLLNSTQTKIHYFFNHPLDPSQPNYIDQLEKQQTFLESFKSEIQTKLSFFERFTKELSKMPINLLTNFILALENEPHNLPSEMEDSLKSMHLKEKEQAEMSTILKNYLMHFEKNRAKWNFCIRQDHTNLSASYNFLLNQQPINTIQIKILKNLLQALPCLNHSDFAPLDYLFQSLMKDFQILGNMITNCQDPSFPIELYKQLGLQIVHYCSICFVQIHSFNNQNINACENLSKSLDNVRALLINFIVKPKELDYSIPSDISKKARQIIEQLNSLKTFIANGQKIHLKAFSECLSYLSTSHLQNSQLSEKAFLEDQRQLILWIIEKISTVKIKTIFQHLMQIYKDFLSSNLTPIQLLEIKTFEMLILKIINSIEGWKKGIEKELKVLPFDLSKIEKWHDSLTLILQEINEIEAVKKLDIKLLFNCQTEKQLEELGLNNKNLEKIKNFPRLVKNFGEEMDDLFSFFENILLELSFPFISLLKQYKQEKLLKELSSIPPVINTNKKKSSSSFPLLKDLNNKKANKHKEEKERFILKPPLLTSQPNPISFDKQPSFIQLQTLLNQLPVHLKISESMIEQVTCQQYIQEAIENIQSYLPFIDEGLTHQSSLEPLISPLILCKITLVLEQTLKASIAYFNPSYLTNKDLPSLKSIHDLEQLWDILKSVESFDDSLLNPSQAKWLNQLNQMVPIYSRYPIQNSFTGISKQFNHLHQEHDKTSKICKEFRQGIEELLNLSLTIWKTWPLTQGLSSNQEIGSLKKLSYSNLVIHKEKLHPQAYEVLSKIEQAQLKYMEKHSKSLLQALALMTNAHYAGRSLIKLLQEDKTLTCPVNTSEAYLLHAAVLLEQSALACLAQLPLVNPNNENEHLLDQIIASGNVSRPWRFSHQISDFIKKIEEEEDKKALSLQADQYLLIEELQIFLAHLYHYPSINKHAPLAAVLSNLRQLGKIRQFLIGQEGWLPPKLLQWCSSHLGENSTQWLRYIDEKIEDIFTTQILPRVKMSLEIGMQILSL